jgi:hypothetical protein
VVLLEVDALPRALTEVREDFQLLVRKHGAGEETPP